jgi:hypothetical protein
VAFKRVANRFTGSNVVRYSTRSKTKIEQEGFPEKLEALVVPIVQFLACASSCTLGATSPLEKVRQSGPCTIHETEL